MRASEESHQRPVLHARRLYAVPKPVIPYSRMTVLRLRIVLWLLKVVKVIAPPEALLAQTSDLTPEEIAMIEKRIKRPTKH